MNRPVLAHLVVLVLTCFSDWFTSHRVGQDASIHGLPGIRWGTFNVPPYLVLTVCKVSAVTYSFVQACLVSPTLIFRETIVSQKRIGGKTKARRKAHYKEKSSWNYTQMSHVRQVHIQYYMSCQAKIQYASNRKIQGRSHL